MVGFNVMKGQKDYYWDIIQKSKGVKKSWKSIKLSEGKYLRIFVV